MLLLTARRSSDTQTHTHGQITESTVQPPPNRAITPSAELTFDLLVEAFLLLHLPVLLPGLSGLLQGLLRAPHLHASLLHLDTHKNKRTLQKNGGIMWPTQAGSPDTGCVSRTSVVYQALTKLCLWALCHVVRWKLVFMKIIQQIACKVSFSKKTEKTDQKKPKKPQVQRYNFSAGLKGHCVVFLP